VHARGMGARVGAEVGGAVPWVAGHGEGRARWRPNARAGGDVRGERARPDIRLEGAKAGVQGRRVRVRRADSLGRAGVGRGELGADDGHEAALCLSCACKFCELPSVNARTILGPTFFERDRFVLCQVFKFRSSCVNHVPSVAEHGDFYM
jgi:hypothetical protein